LKATGVHPFL